MDDFEKFYNKALKFLSFRPRSEKEVFDNLKKKKAPENIIEQIINKLKEHKFLNDEEFARLWIESRMRSKPRSLKLIKMELKQKGISEEIIDEIFNPSTSSGQVPQFSIFNEKEMAKKLVQKKFSKYSNLSKQEVYQKLGRVLAQKGFSWDTIKKAIDESIDHD